MFEENKVWKKYVSIFKGLKRCHQRARKPNKITEYEVPRDPTKYNKKIDDFDPAMLFDLEYAKDEQKKKDKEDAIWGPPPLRPKGEPLKDEKVRVKHLENDRVPSIFEELSQMNTSRPTKTETADTQPAEASTFSNYLKKEKQGDLTERTFRARLTMYEQERQIKE